MKRSLNFLVFPFFLLCVSLSANSQSEGDYRSKTTGFWSASSTWQRYDGSNWQDADKPPLTEDTVNTVTINNTHQVTVADHVIVNKDATLTVMGIITIDEGKVLTVKGTLNLLATLTGTGTVLVNGPMNWSSGTVSINLTISSTGTLNMSSSNSKMIESKTIINQGTINWSDGPFSFANGKIQNEKTFNQTVDRPFSTLGGIDLFTNTATGTFTKSAGALITHVDVPVSNAGIININSGTLSFNRITTHTGTINTFSGAKLRTTGGFTDNGTINIVSGATFSNELDVFTQNNLIDFSGTANINNNATWNINVSQVLNSTTSFFHSGRLGGTSSITVNGPMTWAAGTIAINLTLSSSATMTMSTTNTKTIESKTIKNQGTINWTDGPFSFANGTILNENVFNQSVDRPFSTLGGVDLFTNTATGTFTKSASAGITQIDVPVSNAGIININSGTLSFNRVTTHSGTINTASGTTLRNTGDFTDNGAINIVSGVLFTIEATAVFTQNNLINFSGTININNNATWNVNVLQVLNTTTSFYHSGRLGGTSTITVNGPMTWAAGTVAVNLMLGPTATLSMSTTNTKTIESKTITNQGTINWSDGPFSFANGTIQNQNTFNQSVDRPFSTLGGIDLFTNTATGTFTKSAGAGITQIDVPVSNAGIININNGTLSFNKTTTHTGTINTVSGAKLRTTGGFTDNGTINIVSGAIFSNELDVFTQNNLINFSGTVNINNNATWNVNVLQVLNSTTSFFHSGTLGGTSTLTVNGPMTWTAGTVGVNLTLSATATLTMSTANTKTIESKTIKNQGTINWADGPFSFANGIIQNENAFNQSVDRPFSTLGGNDLFLNTATGTFTKSSMGLTNIDVPVTNAGIFKGTGTLSFNRAFTNTGIVAPGLSPGILTVNGTAPFSSNSTLSIEIKDASGAGTGHDQLQRAGNLTLAGTLTVLETGTVPEGDYIIISLTSGTISGTFATTNLPNGYTLSQTSTTVKVTKGVAVNTGDYRSKQNGIWNFAANWERFDGVAWVAAATFPGSADGVITIRTGHTITVNSSTTMDQVIVQASAAITMNADMTLNNGAGDDLTINGTMNFNEGWLIGPGNLVVAPDAVLNLASTSSKLISAPITNNGIMTWSNGTIYFRAAGVLLTNAGTFNITGNNSLRNEIGADGTFVNSGTMTKTSTGTSDFQVTAFNNSGTINVNAGTLHNKSNPFTNTGNLNFNTGAFINEPNCIFNHKSGSVISGTGSFTNNGKLILNINQTFPSTLLFAVGSTSIIEGPWSLTINNNFIMQGDIEGTGSLTINGNITWNGGSLKRALTVGPAYSLTLATSTPKLIFALITNNGTMDWQNGTIYFRAIGLLLENVGTFNITGNNTMLDEIGALGTFVNNGTITKTSTGTSDFQVAAVINNGTINLNAGTLQNNSSPFTNAGNLNFNNGSFINAINQSFNHNSGSVITGTGSFTNNGTLNLNIDQTFPSTLLYAVGSSSVTIGPGNLTINNNFIMQGDIEGPGSLTVNASIIWNSGALKRALTVAANRSLTFATSNWKLIFAPITNNGSMGWLDGTIYFRSTGVLLTNAGLFHIMGDNNLMNEIGADGSFVNSGNMTKSSTGTTNFLVSGVTNNNSGIIKGVGTISMNSTFNNSGTIAPGLSPGILTMNNQQLFSANSTLSIEIAGNGGAGQPTGHDQLQRSGDLTLSGSLTINETSFAPSGDYTIISLTSGTINGTFSSTTLPAGYTIIYNSNNVVARKGQATCVPAVSIVAVPGNTICSGLPVMFTATPTNGGANPAYQWKLNGSNVGTNSNTYSNNTLVNGDQVSCIMTSSAACASPTTAASNTITMVITATVTPSVSISANPGNTICAGTNVTFTATPTNGGATPSYQWKLNGNNVGTNSNTYSNNALVNGDLVACIMTSSATCTSPTTAPSNVITMTITATVVPSVSISANPGNTICAGTNVIFTATPTNGGSPSYQWKLNGNDVGTNSNIYSNNGLANGDQLSVVMTSSLACASPTTATSNTITMTTTGTVTPSVSIAANPGNTICAGTNVIFTATPTNGGSPSYQWKLNGNNVGTNSNIYSNNGLVNGDQLSVMMTSSLACASPTTATSNIITMVITTTVTPSVSIAANPGNTICAGTNVIFTATPTNGGSPSYQWKLNGNDVGTNSNIYSNNALANGDQLSVVMTSSLACASPTTATSNTNTMTVTTTVTPSVSISANPGNTICAGTNVTFTATSINGGTPSYQWKLNGNNVGTNSNIYSNNTLANGDIVTIAMSSSLTCADPLSATSNSMVMSITSGGINATIASIGNRNRCPQTLQANPGGDVSYQWYKNGLGILGATERRYVANNNGKYSVRVTRNGCSDMSAETDVTGCPPIQTRINTNKEFTGEGLPSISQNDIHLYPNPSSDYVTIELQEDEKINGEATVQLLSLHGQVLLTQKLQVLKGKIYGKLKLNRLWKEEVYLVKVILNKKTYTGKLIRINP